MLLAKRLGRKPRELAGEIAASLDLPREDVQSVEIAGPGFINFRFSQAQWGDRLAAILAAGDEYGRSEDGRGQRVNVEFVSANPTGPFNIVSARAAAVGSTLARVLALAGYKAQTEFYCNDAGRQVALLGESLRARYAELVGRTDIPLPEEGYRGEYVVEMARKLRDTGASLEELPRAESVGRVQGQLPEPNGTPQEWLQLAAPASSAAFERYALRYIIAEQRATCQRFGLRYDTWMLESDLHAQNRLFAALGKLEQRGHVYEQDGAKWFRSTAFGDDQDRVVVRADGRPTYFLADVAYHDSKLSRGFDRAINFLGPDHHGYIARLSAATRALGAGEDWLEVILLQQVNLLEAGQPIEMSKRAGKLVTMEQLIDEVGVDAARYFFLMRKNASHLDFDLTLAKQESSDNPVYYVKYAHARICSVLRNAQAQGLDPDALEAGDLASLDSKPEVDLIRILIELPDTVARAARAREMSRLTNYAGDVATAFHQFYHQCKVLTDDAAQRRARLALCRATKTVLASVLRLCGVSAPERM
jgi:arginyl-tRNA synthetase